MQWNSTPSGLKAVCMHTKLFQLSLTVCDPMDCSPPGSSFHGILQAKILEWVAMPSSRRSSQPRNRIHLSMSPALAGRFFTTSASWEAWFKDYSIHQSLISIGLLTFFKNKKRHMQKEALVQYSLHY